jgi:hypothetical protein
MKKKKVDPNDSEIFSIRDIYDKVACESPEIKNQDDFYERIKDVLNMYIKGLDKRDIINMEAKSSL